MPGLAAQEPGSGMVSLANPRSTLSRSLRSWHGPSYTAALFGAGDAAATLPPRALPSSTPGPPRDPNAPRPTVVNKARNVVAHPISRFIAHHGKLLSWRSYRDPQRSCGMRRCQLTSSGLSRQAQNTHHEAKSPLTLDSVVPCKFFLSCTTSALAFSPTTDADLSRRTGPVTE
jgi:hypothetical protein